MDTGEANMPNSPTPSGLGLLDKAVVDKGLVSNKIDAFWESMTQSANPQPSCHPSFPRARFERVHTNGDWPSCNAELYNQPHPRTMTLAPTSAPLERREQPQHGRLADDKHNQLQVKESRTSKPGVKGLKYLWEIKGQSQIDRSNLQQHPAASSPTVPSLVQGNRPYVQSIRTTMHGVSNSLQSRTTNQGAENSSGSSQDHGGYLDSRINPSEPDRDADSSTLLNYSPTNIRRPKRIAIPVINLRSLSSQNLPSESSNAKNQCSKGTFEVQEKDFEPLTYSNSVKPCPSKTLSTPSAHSTLVSSTPRRGWATESRIPRRFDHQKGARRPRRPSLNETSTTEYHSLDSTGPPEPIVNVQPQITPTRNDKASVTGRPVRMLHYDDNRFSATPALPGTHDAATQTDSLNEHDLEETSSLWFDSESVAERQGLRLSHQRRSKPVRLERRLGRRPGIRKVQVIVSLDGATDLMMDARLKRKPRRRGSHS
ncbi:MAG: hypothetical protein Q9192_000174 [Flavoplaca navasiana]